MVESEPRVKKVLWGVLGASRGGYAEGAGKMFPLLLGSFLELFSSFFEFFSDLFSTSFFKGFLIDFGGFWEPKTAPKSNFLPIF